MPCLPSRLPPLALRLARRMRGMNVGPPPARCDCAEQAASHCDTARAKHGEGADHSAAEGSRPARTRVEGCCCPGEDGRRRGPVGYRRGLGECLALPPLSSWTLPPPSSPRIPSAPCHVLFFCCFFCPLSRPMRLRTVRPTLPCPRSRRLFSMASIMQTPPILCAHAAAYAL